MALKVNKIASAGHPSTTPQSKPIPGRETEMAPNTAGGYSFKLEDTKVLERWMINGSENGTYYTPESEVTVIGTKTLKTVPGEKIVAIAKDVIENGRAPSLDYAIYSLAHVAYHGSVQAKALVYKTIPTLLTNTPQMTKFLECYQAIKKIETGKTNIGGSGICRAISAWYANMNAGQMSYQVSKYPQRNGFHHGDMLRLCHIGRKESNNKTFTVSEDKAQIIQYALWHRKGGDEKPSIITSTNKDHKHIAGKEAIEKATSLEDALKIMKEYHLTHEMVPTKFQGSKDFYEIMLTQSKVYATIRRLGAASAKDVFAPMGNLTKEVVKRITDQAAILDQKVHPMAIFEALKTYQMGRGKKGDLSWKVSAEIVEALEQAFYLAIGNIPETNKNILIAVDHSASMHGAPLDFACAMTAALVRSQKSCHVVGYASEISRPMITKSMNMRAIENEIKRVGIPNGTNCALPFEYAMKECKAADAVISITDGFTWQGTKHVQITLDKWRRDCNKPNGRAIEMVTSMANTSNIDPRDTNSLLTMGMDSKAAILSMEFASEK